MSERGNEKTEWGLCVAKENVEQGAGGGMVRENMEPQKLVMILVLYNAMCCVNVKTGLVLKQSYPMSN